jgi:carbamoyl-phosphate synthase large subunit
MNVQFAVRDQQLYCIEANPRASRTVPFVSKAVGVPLAKVAARVMAGTTLAELRAEGCCRCTPTTPTCSTTSRSRRRCCRSTASRVSTRAHPGDAVDRRGHGIADDFGDAFARAQAGTGTLTLPRTGTVFLSVADRDKRAVVLVARRLVDLGLSLLATDGTARVLERWGVPVTRIGKVTEGDDAIVEGCGTASIDLVFNTPYGPDARGDGCSSARPRSATACRA